jgi:preprotein translocase subunit YajC
MIRSSIVFFFTLAVFFFVMIFLMSAALSHKEQNEINDKTAIQQNEVSTWGYIPGELDYASTQTLNLYSFKSPTGLGATLEMTVSSPYNLAGMRNFTNVTWNPQKSVVDYLIDNQINITLSDPDLPSDHPADETTTYSYPNMASIDTWTQMTTKPRFQLAWEAINQATTILFDADILNRFYAYNANLYMFQDYELVQEFVLIGLTADDQMTVYTEPNFGMNTVKGLTWWVSAASNSDSADNPDYDRLVTYY